METPKYKHDCDQCQFLGQYEGQDLYVCTYQGLIDTVISRFGDEPSEYSSGLTFAINFKHGRQTGGTSRRLAEALTRAEALGLTYDKRLYGED